jgi:hypothetical protein
MLSLVALALSATLASAPAGWAASFTPERLAPLVPAGRARLLVVAAGPVETGVDAAAEALESALLRTGRTGRVMRRGARSDASALDDAAQVRRASSLRVSHVAVVRVFPGRPDEPPTAVVSLYTREGVPVSSFTARQGSPLEARESRPTPAAPLRPPRMSEVPLPEPEPQPVPFPEEKAGRAGPPEEELAEAGVAACRGGQGGPCSGGCAPR